MAGAPDAEDRMYPTYVVVATSRRPGPVRMQPAAADVRRARASDQPVGVRHAVRPDGDSAGGLRRAVCGEDVAGWAVFLDVPFTGREGADCRRCEQLIRAAGRPAHAPGLRGGGAPGPPDG